MRPLSIGDYTVGVLAAQEADRHDELFPDG